MLTRSGFQRVLLYVVAHAHRIRAFLHKRGWLSDDSDRNSNRNATSKREKTLRVEVHELEAASAGDYSKLSAVGEVLRDVYTRELLKSTRDAFVLMSGDTVTNLDLRELLETHKRVASDVDRNCVLSAFVRELPPAAAEYDADTLLVTDERGKLYAFESRNVVDSLDDEHADTKPKARRRQADRLAHELRLRRASVLTGAALRVRSNVTRTDIYCCAALVPSLFADNYDYVSMTDLISGVIEHEETQQYAAFAHVCASGVAVRLGCARRSFGAAVHVARLVRTGFAYPFTSHSNFLLPYNVASSVPGPKGSRFRECFVHGCARVGDGCVLVNSVVSERANVGVGCFLHSSILLPDCVLEADCSVQRSVLGEKVRVGAKSVVQSECVLDSGVCVGTQCCVPSGTRLTTDFRKLPYKVRFPDRLAAEMKSTCALLFTKLN